MCKNILPPPSINVNSSIKIAIVNVFSITTMVKTSDRIPCVQRGKGQLSHTFPKLFINTIISLIGFHPLCYPLNSLHVLNSGPCIPGLIDAYTTFPRITLPFSLPWVLMLLGKASHTKYINSELAYFCEYICEWKEISTYMNKKHEIG